ncbi:MAG: glycosyltransferase family 4 protein [bacterium]
MPKRILIFSTAYLPLIGGAEIAIKEITDRIADIEFDMLCLRFDKNLPKFEKIGNINVYRLGFAKKNPAMSDLVSWPLKLNKYFFPFMACAKALSLHKKKKYDGIWAMMAAYAGFAAMFFKALDKKTPYLLTLQEGDPFSEIKKKVSLIFPVFKIIFTKADYVQVISNYLADFARQMGYDGDLAVVPNGVDIKKFKVESLKFKVDESRKKLGIGDNDKIIITVSRLVKKNAVGDVVKSLAYLPQNVKFLILGSGPDEKKLKSLVENLKLSARVIMLGSVKNELVPEYLAIADIFIRPSLSEGQGIAFLEAMAAGTPVIATEVGGIVDFLRDRETGLFCRMNNPESIAEKVEEFLNNNELAEKIKINAKSMIEKDYDWNLIAIKMKNIFFNLIK